LFHKDAQPFPLESFRPKAVAPEHGVAAALEASSSSSGTT